MKRLCSICVRGGSKGLKNKNMRELGGLPLFAHSIKQAQQSKLFDCIVVSSDSEAILRAATVYGADYAIIRPENLATDNAPKLPAIQHALLASEKLANARFDVVVDLDATSPLRVPLDIENMVQILEEENVSNVISGCPARRSPYFNLVELGEDGFVRLSKPLKNSVTRRQDSPKCYDMNASIYVWQREALLKNDSIFNRDTRLYVMPEERSMDIDSALDFEFVEFLYKRDNSAEIKNGDV
ncbi:MAG: acylneuraminate cytidylyltransferase family protein [Candidatus Nitrohelix vancouverensis]|uniref:Acylneuraminate cytidylyltransferase family protein n=1 Tax=Candidatus Nitrohelix vancouverensis TaxID=2705534 RepID=A0A7T0C058_9BACT|nr:MAG: acylneuraminate cytidylyltransferase family protein [Candidatus Nitrohelix vancouverensis]